MHRCNNVIRRMDMKSVNRAKMLLSLLLCLAMVFSLAACSPASNEPEATPRGDGRSRALRRPRGRSRTDWLHPRDLHRLRSTATTRPMTVEVTVNENAIESVNVTSDFETIGVGKVAIERTTAAIVDAQSLAVDIITGASITTRSVIAAAKDCLTQAGGDIEALTAEKPAEPAQGADL